MHIFVKGGKIPQQIPCFEKLTNATNMPKSRVITYFMAYFSCILGLLSNLENVKFLL
jgi:hypothetical protein